MDLVEALYRPVYDEWGAAAVLTVAAQEYGVTAIDRGEGLSAGGGPLVQTTSLAASVIEADIIALGLTRDDLDGAGLVLNGAAFTVTSVKRDPTTGGAGELYLYLEAAA